jgi:hypothetical protein
VRHSGTIAAMRSLALEAIGILLLACGTSQESPPGVAAQGGSAGQAGTTTAGGAAGEAGVGGASNAAGTSHAEGGVDADGSAGAAQPTPSPKKGVGTWFMKDVDANLSEVNVSWWYAWGASPAQQAITSVIPFVPMIWDETHVNAQELAEVQKHGSVLLGFNEPDHTDQADMTVQQALDLWPQLVATNMRLGSPATAENPANAGSWLDQFMSSANSKGYRVDFICVHWYGANFDTSTAIDELQSYLEGVHDHFGLPIWITEYSLINWTNSQKFPSWSQQAAFATASVAMLEMLPYVERYAWFAMPPFSDDPSETIYLYDETAAITATGVAYRAAGVL